MENGPCLCSEPLLGPETDEAHASVAVQSPSTSSGKKDEGHMGNEIRTKSEPINNKCVNADRIHIWEDFRNAGSFCRPKRSAVLTNTPMAEEREATFSSSPRIYSRERLEKTSQASSYAAGKINLVEEFNDEADIEGDLDGQNIARPVFSSKSSNSDSKYEQITETEEEVDPNKCLEGINLLFDDKETGMGLPVSTNGKEDNVWNYTPPAEIPINSTESKALYEADTEEGKKVKVGGTIVQWVEVCDLLKQMGLV
ncbi:hypothetical protein TorRG33x02_264320 [Trema orientale]|uniref:Uncharacterized protein n=1 Tax=Trema orientale TaxID=63057 RepID=A0A2P5D2R2_TREOI|nr:hypothetical protein TorRG33x02_264320 [Trema orientale]